MKRPEENLTKKSKVERRKLKGQRLQAARSSLLLFALAFVDGQIDLASLTKTAREYRAAEQDTHEAC